MSYQFKAVLVRAGQPCGIIAGYSCGEDKARAERYADSPLSTFSLSASFFKQEFRNSYALEPEEILDSGRDIWFCALVEEPEFNEYGEVGL